MGLIRCCRSDAKETPPNLHPRLTIVVDDIGGGVGLAPFVGQVGSGPDDIDRRVRDASLGLLWTEATRGNDLHLIEAVLIQDFRIRQMAEAELARSDRMPEFIVAPVSPDRVRLVPFNRRVGAAQVQAFDIPAAMGVETHGETTTLRKIGKRLHTASASVTS